MRYLNITRQCKEIFKKWLAYREAIGADATEDEWQIFVEDVLVPEMSVTYQDRHDAE